MPARPTRINMHCIVLNPRSSAVHEANQKSAFVIMPFSPTASEKNWTEIFDTVFKPAIEECGYACERAAPSTGSLIISIVESLRRADLVIADVTDRNPNVFYELGVRHSLRRGTIIVSQDGEHVPSDLRGYWYLTYGLRPRQVLQFKSAIRKIIAAIRKAPNRSDNPVADYLDREQINISHYVQRDNVKKLGALLTELSGNRLAIAQQLSSGEAQPLSHGCIQLLVQTLYVDIGPELLKTCYELEYRLGLIIKGGANSGILEQALERTELLFERISDIRDRIGRGEFAEPAVASTMVWSPAAPLRSTAIQECTMCSGSGQIECPTCRARVITEETDSLLTSVDRHCIRCNGSGMTSCPSCSSRESTDDRLDLTSAEARVR